MQTSSSLNTNFIIFNTKFIVFNANFIIFDTSASLLAFQPGTAVAVFHGLTTPVSSPRFEAENRAPAK